MQPSKIENLNYVQLANPMTFEDIFRLWVGEDKYNEIIAYDPKTRIPWSQAPDFDDYLCLIRQVENVLDDAIKTGRVHLYMKSSGGAGRTFFFGCQYDQGGLFSRTREGYGKELHKCFQFMRHHPDFIGAESTPLYFDQNEIFAQFPFLPSGLAGLPSAEQKTYPTKETPAEPVTEPALPPIKKRVSTSGSKEGNIQVQNTHKENPEAVAYANARRAQGASDKEIAVKLKAAGGSSAVIGCIMNPDCADITAARNHGKYLLKKPAKN